MIVAIILIVGGYASYVSGSWIPIALALSVGLCLQELMLHDIHNHVDQGEHDA